MSSAFDLGGIQRRMAGAVDSLKHEFSGLRTGRASANMLDPVMVEAYGASVPISQVGNVSTPEARMLSVQVWDNALVGAVDRAIRNSGLGLNPVLDGTMLRIPVPELNEERRKDLVKVAGKYTEATRVAVRNVRRDGMDILKKLEKDGDISQDDQKNLSEKVQKLTDETIKTVDQMLVSKEKEILQV
ncbi:ribosome recycling factor [Govanella unica]|uniref:Ribosome-recycling factor n=1 Tax=Govanella unica TaxID=2975056 RepID=A0A9X3TY02_9PROT|nr:ribosome recycling factor [Govania unica]MDA5193769.1 ribosome recycling factor [Govania unica]